MEWPFVYPDPAAPEAPVAPEVRSESESEAEHGSRSPWWRRIVSFRNVSYVALVVLAILPWFVHSQSAPAKVYSHAQRVTLRMLDSRLDRIEAELMAIYRRTGGKETDTFPMPPWLVRDRDYPGLPSHHPE